MQYKMLNIDGLLRPMIEVEKGRKAKSAARGNAMTVTYDVPLSMKEIEVVRFIIDRYRKAMIFELANTDSRELKDHLRHREEMLQSITQRLDAFSGEPDETEPVD